MCFKLIPVGLEVSFFGADLLVSTETISCFAVVAIFLSSRAVGLAPYPVSTGQLDSRQAVGDNFA